MNDMSNSGTSVLHVIEYFIGFPVFGIVYNFLNGIVVDMAVATGSNGDVYNYAMMFWTGSIAIYIIIGVFWLPGKIREIKRGG